jgi:hypothetical protein
VSPEWTASGWIERAARNCKRDFRIERERQSSVAVPLEDVLGGYAEGFGESKSEQ